MPGKDLSTKKKREEKGKEKGNAPISGIFSCCAWGTLLARERQETKGVKREEKVM